MKRLLIILLVAAAALVAWRSLVFVDEAEFVIVTQFGRPVSTLREAGLHFKMPYQSALRIDRRIQIYDPRPSEFLAREKKNIDLDMFVCWRVEEPQKFIETVGDFAGAEARLHDIVWSELAAEVGRNPVEALVSTQPQVHRLDEIVAAVAGRCAQRSAAAYGIGIVDVRLKRVSLPAQVRDSVFARMRAERSRIARQYRAEGEEEALKIRATADRERTVTLAKAYAEAEKIRGQGDAEATRIYAEAYQQDLPFYELVRTLEAYRKFLDDKTTVVLSADSDLLRFLTREAALGDAPAAQPSGAQPPGPPPAAAPGSPPRAQPPAPSAQAPAAPRAKKPAPPAVPPPALRPEADGVP
ncbi:MAG: protease modulator HflC [Planctomycetes bacterium]|nr:protease modulator HflC [Planctomycetota bacterium]